MRRHACTFAMSFVAMVCATGCRPANKNADHPQRTVIPVGNSATHEISHQGRYTVYRIANPQAGTLSGSDRIIISFDGQPIYTYTARYLKDDPEFPPRVELAYDTLTPRGGQPQPKPFDDVLGTGHLSILLIESATGYNNRESVTNYLTIVRLSGGKAHEIPAVPWTGEVLYLRDFNGDGCMEIVNTDGERDFNYGRDGMPFSTYVWRFDPKEDRYERTLSGARQDERGGRR